MIVPFARTALVLALAALPSCQLLAKKSDANGSDASAASATAAASTTAPSATDGGVKAAVAAPALPTTFELVAVGKKPGSKIVWLKLVGDRVWLSGAGVDAYADGDKPLTPAPDLTQGQKKKPGESYEYTGSGSNLLFAVRSFPETAKSEDPPTVWVRDGSGPWSSGTKVPHIFGVHNWLQQFGFVPWKDGALLVTSQISVVTSMMLAAPAAAGTDFQSISPKGEIKDVRIDIPKEVMVWAADSDGSTLALVGFRAKKLRAEGISVFRGDGQTALTETPIMGDPGTQDPKALSLITVREQGDVALAYITSLYYGGGALASLASTVFVVGRSAAEPKKIQFGPEKKGAVAAAAYVGGSVYATVVSKEHYTLSRAAGGAEPAPVKLPSLAKGASGFQVAKEGEPGLACEAVDLFARKNDLWVQASCTGPGGKVPAVFRLGHPQAPILLP
jgi:hypothetical protein